MLLKVFKILNKNLSKKMVCIYVLQLEGGKWYVGKTDNPGMRLEDHKQGHGSQWTRKYNPVKVKKIVPDCDEYDEDKYTLKYMKKHGMENVRGGSFCQMNLDAESKKTIARMNKGAGDECYKCGEGGHFANQCHYKQQKTRISKCSVCTLPEGTCKHTQLSEELSNTAGYSGWECDNCGKEFDSLKGATYHQNFYCKKQKSYSPENSDNSCFRCGRLGHYVDSCYATYHNDGYKIEEEGGNQNNFGFDTFSDSSFTNEEDSSDDF